MTWGVKLGFALSMMLSDESASMRVFGVSAPDFSPSFNPTYRLVLSEAGNISMGFLSRRIGRGGISIGILSRRIYYRPP